MSTNSFDERRQPTLGLRREQLAVMGVVALLLAAVFIPQGFRYLRQTAPAPVAPEPPLKPSLAGEFRGLSIQMQSNDPHIPYEDYVREIAGTGANTICISVAALQENAASSSVFLEYRRTPPSERLEKIFKLAHELGLRVVLMPIVLLENPGTGEWRGKITPKEPDAWWEDYENYVLLYAQLAEKCKLEVFMVGSELVLMEPQTERWKKLFAKVRKVYSGLLSYSANWDHYEPVQFWRDLDLVGMTSYYDLVGDKKPSLEVLLETWKPIKEKILKWQKDVGRPIIFTEAGWPSQEGCAKEPWNYYGSTKPDPTTQDLCFQAFFKTWQGEKIVAGILIWEWRNGPWQKGGPDDLSYIPMGKPVMKTIREYFQSPAATAGAATRPASQPTTATTKPTDKNGPVAKHAPRK